MNLHLVPRVLLALLVWLLAPRSPLVCQQAVAQGEELFRIRVHNAVGGAIEVSADGGNHYATVGKVVRPATRLVPGFAASRYAPVASVAAVAVHGLRIKVRPPLPGEPKNASETMMMSLVPREFHTPPPGYAGHMADRSGIYTDIACGEAIFRNLAPFVGNPVRLELPDRLVPFPEDYQPHLDDRIVILVLRPPEMPREIVFENWKGGQVIACFEGRDPQPIARVVRPVLGVGRYDGTTYTGVGRINTNHCGVITISTAGVTGFLLPEGRGSERRGGFQIEPVQHAQQVSRYAPQVMVVEPLEGQGPLEGQPPLFSGYIGLFWDRQSPERSFLAEVKIDNGAWEAMPEVVGKQDDAFTARRLTDYFRSLGVERQVTSGVTHLRVCFPRLDKSTVAHFLEGYPSVASTEPASATSTNPTRVQGVVTLNVELKNITDVSQIAMLIIYVDGRFVAMLNTSPFRHDLDTRRLSNGLHEVELRAVDAAGSIIAQKKTTILVDNPPPTEQGKTP